MLIWYVSVIWNKQLCSYINHINSQLTQLIKKCRIKELYHAINQSFDVFSLPCIWHYIKPSPQIFQNKIKYWQLVFEDHFAYHILRIMLKKVSSFEYLGYHYEKPPWSYCKTSRNEWKSSWTESFELLGLKLSDKTTNFTMGFKLAEDQTNQTQDDFEPLDWK